MKLAKILEFVLVGVLLLLDVFKFGHMCFGDRYLDVSKFLGSSMV